MAIPDDQALGRWRGSPRLAWWLFAVGCIGLLASFALRAVNARATGIADITQPLGFLAIGIAGLAIARRKPENAVGWLYLGVWFAVGVIFAFTGEYGYWATETHPGVRGRDVRGLARELVVGAHPRCPAHLDLPPLPGWATALTPLAAGRVGRPDRHRPLVDRVRLPGSRLHGCHRRVRAEPLRDTVADRVLRRRPGRLGVRVLPGGRVLDRFADRPVPTQPRRRAAAGEVARSWPRASSSASSLSPPSTAVEGRPTRSWGSSWP